MPIFSSTPARMTEPAVGASTCASGSQVWNGNSGTLIANASAKARKNQLSIVPRQLHAVEIEEVEARQVRRADLGVRPGKPDDGEQHQDAARHRVEHELDGGVDAALVAPDADEEIHRNQHRVPEDVEEEEVDRDKHAEHRRLEREHEEREQLDALVHRLPRAQQRQRRQEPGQHDEEQADAVDANQVLDAEHRHPGVGLDELVVGAGRIEAPPQHQRRRKGRERRRRGRRCAPAARVRADRRDHPPAGRLSRPTEEERRLTRACL